MFILISCSIEPDVTVDVPEGAFVSNTSINVEVPDIAKALLDQIESSAVCEFEQLPSSDEGFIAKCVTNCCLWVYEDDYCIERWCLNLKTQCGWELIDWNCIGS
jgi:hypothetical protein